MGCLGLLRFVVFLGRGSSKRSMDLFRVINPLSIGLVSEDGEDVKVLKVYRLGMVSKLFP